MAERSSTPRTKRALDLGLGLVLALVLTPLMLLAAIGSAISFRARPIFVQDRVGVDGRSFRFLKIRSLPAATPAAVDKYELQSVENTGFGRFLRRTHLDELPQLWLVVFGRMSLVGPRPEMPALLETFEPTFAARRSRMRPGCTGLWQISTAVDGLIGEAPEYDLHYVDRWTLRLDMWILARTLGQCIGARRVKDLGQVPTWTGAALVEAVEALA